MRALERIGRAFRLGATLAISEQAHRLVASGRIATDAGELDNLELGLRTSALEWLRKACELALCGYRAEIERRDFLEESEPRPGVH